MKKKLCTLFILCSLFTTSVIPVDKTPHRQKLYRRLANTIGDNNTLGILTLAFGTLTIGSGASCLKNAVRAKKAITASDKLYHAAIATITGSLAVCCALPAGLFAYSLIFR